VSTREEHLVLPVRTTGVRALLIAFLLRRGVYTLLLMACIYGALASPGFRHIDNIINVMQDVSYVGVVALGMTFVTLSGAFVDLSVVSVISGAAVIVLRVHSVGWLGAILAALAFGFLVGAINGLLVNRFKANPILLTLATNTVVGGVVLTMVSGHYSYGSDLSLQAFGQASLGAIPLGVVILVAIAVIAELAVRFTTWGQRVRAAGGNAQTALYVGLKPQWLRGQAFILSGLGAAVAGIMLATSLNAASPTVGTGYDFNAIIAVVIGGASLNGGTGSPLGTLAGAMLVGILDNLLVLNGVAFALQQVVTGVVLATAVGLDVIAHHFFD